MQTHPWTARICLTGLGSSICLHHSSASVYFQSFLSRSPGTHFFWRHMNLTNSSAISQGWNFPQKSTLNCSINSHPMHLALGQGLCNVWEDLALLLFTSSQAQSQVSSHFPSVGGRKKPNPLSLVPFKCFPLFQKSANHLPL